MEPRLRVEGGRPAGFSWLPMARDREERVAGSFSRARRRRRRGFSRLPPGRRGKRRRWPAASHGCRGDNDEASHGFQRSERGRRGWPAASRDFQWGGEEMEANRLPKASNGKEREEEEVAGGFSRARRRRRRGFPWLPTIGDGKERAAGGFQWGGEEMEANGLPKASNEEEREEEEVADGFLQAWRRWRRGFSRLLTIGDGKERAAGGFSWLPMGRRGDGGQWAS